jgi:hypothetical protein
VNTTHWISWNVLYTVSVNLLTVNQSITKRENVNILLKIVSSTTLRRQHILRNCWLMKTTIIMNSSKRYFCKHGKFNIRQAIKRKVLSCIHVFSNLARQALYFRFSPKYAPAETLVHTGMQLTVCNIIIKKILSSRDPGSHW